MMISIRIMRKKWKWCWKWSCRL